MHRAQGCGCQGQCFCCAQAGRTCHEVPALCAAAAPLYGEAAAQAAMCIGAAWHTARPIRTPHWPVHRSTQPALAHLARLHQLRKALPPRIVICIPGCNVALCKWYPQGHGAIWICRQVAQHRAPSYAPCTKSVHAAFRRRRLHPQTSSNARGCSVSVAIKAGTLHWRLVHNE